MSDAKDRIAEIVKSNDVVLFMKGTALFPQCGFSSRAVAILDHLGVPFETVDVLQDPEIRQGIKEYSRLADGPPALCEGRIRRRVGHHDGNVRERRAAAAGRRGSELDRAKKKGRWRGTREPLHRPFHLAWNQSGRHICSNGRANS